MAVGLATLVLGTSYTLSCTRKGGGACTFRGHRRPRAAGRDVGGLLRGRLPAAEGGGLFALLEGLLLVLLLATAATGAVVLGSGLE